MKVFGWGADEGGCRWYRLTTPFEALAARGHTVRHAITYDKAFDDADVVVGQRVAMPGSSTQWSLWAAAGRRLVYDIDDDYLHLDASNPGFDFYSKADVQARIIANVRTADTVTVATPRLAEVYRPFNDEVRVVPNGIPERVLSWERPQRRHSGVTVGWAGTPSTLPDLAPIVGMLRRFLDRNPEVELHTVGISEGALRKVGLRHDRLRVTPSVAGTENYLRRIDFDIWVAPYRHTRFNGAKVPTKALEAAALGIPIVASGTEPYRRHVADGRTGVVIHRDHEWDRALRDLVHSPETRAAMGAAARQQARDHTIERIAPLWENALGGAA